MQYQDFSTDNIIVNKIYQKTHQSMAYLGYLNPVTFVHSEIIIESELIEMGDWNRKFKGANSFIEIPLESELEKYFDAINIWANSYALREKLFDKESNKYSFLPCIMRKMKTSEIIYYVKMYYDTCAQNFEGKNVLMNKTMMVELDDDRRNIIDAFTVTHVNEILEQCVRFKIFFSPYKIWIKKMNNTMLYGIKTKIKAIEYIPSSSPLHLSPLDFIDSSDEEEEEEEASDVID